ncbi:MAG: neocarzinostatin apoprotein domain-containing protein [Acidimicrobiales bacterium]
MNQRQRMQAGWWGLAVVALVAVVAAPAVLGGSDDTEGDDAAVEEEAAPVLAPHDGLDSLGLPVVVTPADGLVHDQVVTVSGEGFPAHRQLGVVMCSRAVELGGGAAQCMLSPFTPVESDAEGRFSVEFTVRRILVIGGHEVDCAAPPPDGLPATCAIAVGAISDYDQSGTAPVSFDASVDPPPRPSFAVAPTEGLVDGDIITVTARDLGADMGWHTMVCARFDEAPADWHLTDDVICDYSVWPVTVDEAGQHQDLVASRWFGHSLGIEPIDCGEAPGRCWVQVEGGFHVHDPVPLTFDTSVPAPPKPEVFVEEWDPYPGPTVVDPDGFVTDTTLVGDGDPLPPPETTIPGTAPSTTVVSSTASSSSSSGP